MMAAIVHSCAFESLIGLVQMYCTQKGQLLFPLPWLFVLQALIEYKLPPCFLFTCQTTFKMHHIMLFFSLAIN